jgi:uncharacterized protein (DUF433 family)
MSSDSGNSDANGQLYCDCPARRRYRCESGIVLIDSGKMGRFVESPRTDSKRGFPTVSAGLYAQESAYEGRLDVLEKIMDPFLVKRDPEIMSGALCFAGTRVPVKNLFDYLEGSSSLEEFLADFPSVTRERAVAVLEAARERLAVDASALMSVFQPAFAMR